MKKLFIGLFIIFILCVNFYAAKANSLATVTHDGFNNTYTVVYNDVNVDFVLLKFTHTDGNMSLYQTIIHGNSGIINVNEVINSTGGTFELWVARPNTELTILSYTLIENYQIVLPLITKES